MELCQPPKWLDGKTRQWMKYVHEEGPILLRSFGPCRSMPDNRSGVQDGNATLQIAMGWDAGNGVNVYPDRLDPIRSNGPRSAITQ